MTAISPSRASSRVLTTLLAIVLLVSGTLAAAGAPDAVALAGGCTTGTMGIGDDIFPTMGNGGYDVQHYDLDLSLDVEAGAISDAKVRIDALAMVNLCAFNLDFEGLTIDSLQVNGGAADYTRRGKELSITPATPLAAGETFTVEVRYHGAPKPAAFADGSEDGTMAGPDGTGGADPGEYPVLRGGWFVAENEIFVVGQPTGSRFWYPVNEHPADKATYTARYTVARPFDVVANGTPVERIDNGATTTVVWNSGDPIASYLVTMHAGMLETEELVTASGVPVRLSFAASVPEAQRAVLRKLPEMVDFAESVYGPYPFESIGATVAGVSMDDLALETQTLPIFGAMASGKDAAIPAEDLAYFEDVIFHEVAHQWFGNSVSLQRWDDIWMNEGFAMYGEVLWIEHAQGTEARDAFLERLSRANANMASGDATPVLVGDPGAASLFSGTVYIRGALTLHALREEVGDDAFFAILQAWTARYANGNGATGDFIATAEEVSGRDLRAFFDAWLYSADVPG